MTGPTWSTACPDWEQRIVAGQSLIPFDPLFPAEAERALEVFDALRIVDAPDSPTFGEASPDWIRNLVAAIFGAYDPVAGRQLLREIFLLISKKNGKSTDAAAIMMTALILNWRSSAELLIIAPTKAIAANSFTPARDMVLADDDLRDLMHVQDHYRTITHRETDATLKVLAADSDTVSGTKSAIVLIDEYWLFGKNPRADAMLREATGGLAARPEGFVLKLSTQSDDPPAGVFRRDLLRARRVRDGEIVDPAFLPVLYEFPRAMVKAKAYLEPKYFHVTNPSLGYSVDVEFLNRELAKAEEDGADALQLFVAKHLNVEPGVGLKSERWAGADHWQDCADQPFGLDELLARSEIVTIGIDGGGLDDLLGLAVIGREAATEVDLTEYGAAALAGEPVSHARIEARRWWLWARAWAHPSVLERRKEIAPKLQDLADAGELVIVKNAGDDVDELAEIVKRIYDAGTMDRIGVDPHAIGAILEGLVARQIPEDLVVGVSQGWRLVGAIKTLERRLSTRTVRHSGSMLMAWCVGNAKVVPRGNAQMITKQISGSAKIDPLMAALNATTLMALNPKAKSAPLFEVW